jgi:hypothetical protein
MNFVDHAALNGVARSHGFRGGAAPDAAPKFDAFLYRLTKAALDLVRIVTQQKTVQPEHFFTLAKIGALLDTPVGWQTSSRHRGGGDYSLPAAYYDTHASGAYHADAPAHHDSDVSMIRAAMHQSMTGGACACKGRQAGGEAYPPEYYSASVVDPAYAGGSPPAARIISDETMLRIIREYRARGGSAVESMRISDPAKHRLREIIEANVVAALHQAKKKGGAASAQKLTGAAVSKLAASWTLRVISR